MESKLPDKILGKMQNTDDDATAGRKKINLRPMTKTLLDVAEQLPQVSTNLYLLNNSSGRAKHGRFVPANEVENWNSNYSGRVTLTGQNEANEMLGQSENDQAELNV